MPNEYGTPDYDPPRLTWQGERWAWIPGFEGRYEASNQGRIRSHVHTVVPIVRAQSWRGEGNTRRLMFSTCVDGNRGSMLIHRAVLLAFVGRPAAGQEGCHNDGDPTNNRLTNLRWDTKAANAADRDRHGTTPRGETHGMSKLTEEQVREIRDLSDRGIARRAVADRFGVSRQNVRLIAQRKAWRHVA